MKQLLYIIKEEEFAIGIASVNAVQSAKSKNKAFLAADPLHVGVITVKSCAKSANETLHTGKQIQGYMVYTDTC